MQLHISRQLSIITPFPFDHNYTCRRVKWGEHRMGPMQQWLTTATHLNLRRSFLKPEHWVPIFKKYISASNIRPAHPSYMIYYISLLSFHPLWASPPPPGASRGSAIHVFLVYDYLRIFMSGL